MSRPTPRAVVDPPEDLSLADSHSENPAVRELLDHVAEELAEEYIDLNKEAAVKPGTQED